MLEEYTREQVLGYVIMTLMNEEKSKKEINKIIHELDKNIDEWTETYAEQIHDNFYGI